MFIKVKSLQTVQEGKAALTYGENWANRHQKPNNALHRICNIVITEYNLGVSAWHHIHGEKGVASLEKKQPGHIRTECCEG